MAEAAGEGGMNGLSVIIPSKTSANLGACVDAIGACDPNIKVIVVWDGSDVPSPTASIHGPWTMPPNVKSIGVLSGISPFIFARNVNLGIRAAGDDDVILLNDDALLQTPSGFTAIQRHWYRSGSDCGVIGPVTNVSGNMEQLRSYIKPEWDEISGVSTVGTLRETQRTVPFLCAFVPRGTINRVGLLDERFDCYGWEDADYCRRVRNAGLKVGIFDGCFVDHGSLKSTFRGDPRNGGDLAKGRAIYLQKWGDAG